MFFEDYFTLPFRTLMRNCVSQDTRMIITTQISQFSNDQILFIRLPNFTDVKSKTFLQENLDQASDEEIRNLSSKLGQFPLCLQQAVSCIKNHTTEISLFYLIFKSIGNLFLIQEVVYRIKL